MPPFHIAIVSPHRDDAAFSCGIFLEICRRQGQHVDVWNLFTRSAYAPYAATVDPEQITRLRAAEDAALLADLGSGFRLHDLGLADAPVRLGIEAERVVDNPLTTAEVSRETNALAKLLAPLADYNAVFAPLALGGHIDHALAREAARTVVVADRLAFYEDVPYVCRQSAEDTAQAIVVAGLGLDQGWLPATLTCRGGAEVKARMAALYPSQIDEAVVCEIRDWAAGLHDGESYRVGRGLLPLMLCNFPAKPVMVAEEMVAE